MLTREMYLDAGIVEPDIEDGRGVIQGRRELGIRAQDQALEHGVKPGSAARIAVRKERLERDASHDIDQDRQRELLCFL